MALESVVVSLDGESKCGKTTIIESISGEAEYQHGIIPSLINSDLQAFTQDPEELARKLDQLQQVVKFNNIVTVSAGNSFRAAALYVALRETTGIDTMRFTEADSEIVREILALEGIEDVLQNDPNVTGRVSDVAKLSGAQALCGTIFCDFVSSAVNMGGGGNLVIVDARDPIGHMQRNGLIGEATEQVRPTNVLPIYVDTSAEVAAARMKGDYRTNLKVVTERRETDATRKELPVVRPSEVIEDFAAWHSSLYKPKSTDRPYVPYRLENGESVDLENIQYAAGVIAVTAHDLALNTLPRDNTEAA